MHANDTLGVSLFLSAASYHGPPWVAGVKLILEKKQGQRERAKENIKVIQRTEFSPPDSEEREGSL